MSHIVQRSNTKGPADGQNGLSPGAKHGFTSEWYSAVANTVWRPPDDVVRPGREPRCSRHALRVSCPAGIEAARRLPRSRCARFAVARSTPRSENPNPQLDRLPRGGRAAPQQAERPQCGGPDVVEVESRAALHQAPVVPEHLTPARCVALDVERERSALYHDLALCAAVGPSDWSWARSGTVAPCSIASPPSDRSMTSRASVDGRERVAVDRRLRVRP